MDVSFAASAAPPLALGAVTVDFAIGFHWRV